MAPHRTSLVSLVLLFSLAAPGFVHAGIVVPDDAPENPARTPFTVVSQQVDVSIIDHFLFSF